MHQPHQRGLPGGFDDRVEPERLEPPPPIPLLPRTLASEALACHSVQLGPWLYTAQNAGDVGCTAARNGSTSLCVEVRERGQLWLLKVPTDHILLAQASDQQSLTALELTLCSPVLELKRMGGHGSAGAAMPAGRKAVSTISHKRLRLLTHSTHADVAAWCARVLPHVVYQRQAAGPEASSAADCDQLPTLQQSIATVLGSGAGYHGDWSASSPLPSWAGTRTRSAAGRARQSGADCAGSAGLLLLASTIGDSGTVADGGRGVDRAPAQPSRKRRAAAMDHGVAVRTAAQKLQEGGPHASPRRSGGRTTGGPGSDRSTVDVGDAHDSSQVPAYLQQALPGLAPFHALSPSPAPSQLLVDFVRGFCDSGAGSLAGLQAAGLMALLAPMAVMSPIVEAALRNASQQDDTNTGAPDHENRPEGV
ncbi:unnamed protein product [Pedinophyceae sp. YPF-701]|nr:unnamed protein product [Pedinophyceae sp. YPF-701]